MRHRLCRACKHPVAVRTAPHLPRLGSSGLESGLDSSASVILELVRADPEDLGVKTVPHRHPKRGNMQEGGIRGSRRFCVWGAS